MSIRPSLGLLVLCALGGMSLGALNEMIEFLAVLTIPDTNVSGYDNIRLRDAGKRQRRAAAAS